MPRKYSMEGLGVRASDWEDVCRAALKSNVFDDIIARIRDKAIERNRTQQPIDSGMCASHRPLFPTGSDW